MAAAVATGCFVCRVSDFVIEELKKGKFFEKKENFISFSISISETLRMEQAYCGGHRPQPKNNIYHPPPRPPPLPSMLGTGSLNCQTKKDNTMPVLS
jgi:hypothetical protein